ncbi:TusE/DsrC/DsvC family sulfur relay protein [Parashewanella spongiae]|uniref:Sulfurtransferase n=1 Tax=Parashewanella spongiae TaxID=342950 RepID=A0A3A6UJE3_9GAMM|nr:TusE/DsrC/DsvC family sulfur relay protein [Parashewanella spongiae]MCL1076867.1 TusE/DsrC/DsvC family sulfur relay protein [Parashewanella spongiae]RJY19234.1 TusE/DsrC/DsvC family sulfur relay protein [Parashewanella spongiae]
MNYIIHNEEQISVDKQGYLTDYTIWSKDIALVVAEKENITLTDAHWEVIQFVRDFYLEFKTSPAIRALVKAIALKLGTEKGNSKYLYKLFPLGPAKQATKIAGLPKPARCI